MGLETRETGSSQEGRQLSHFGGVTVYHLRVHTLWQAATYLEEPQRHKRLLRQVATTSIARTQPEVKAIRRAKEAIGAQSIITLSLREWQELEAAETGNEPTLVVSDDDNWESLAQKRIRIDLAETTLVRQFARDRHRYYHGTTVQLADRVGMGRGLSE